MIIDDLDRIEVDNIKKALFIVKKVFPIKNMSFVLCYDTENILIKDDVKKYDHNLEFLEKYINIKFSLYSNQEKWQRVVLQEAGLKDEVEGNILYGIVEILDSDNEDNYSPYLGNIRKFKRLINTIKTLKLDDKNLYDYDFDYKDLINLLIIYLYYPHIFRKIYATELNGGRGYFSRIYDISFSNSSGSVKGIDGCILSTFYYDYIDKINEPQKFILNQIFDPEFSTGNDDYRRIRACYNGGYFDSSTRNLERYINLIVDSELPDLEEQLMLYKNISKRILASENISDIMWNIGFEVADGEEKHVSLFKTLSDCVSQENVSIEKLNELVKWMLENIKNYSWFDRYEVRFEVLLYLAKLINQYNGERKKEIGRIIYEENEYTGKSILSYICNDFNNILWLYDLITFSHICASHQSGFFNLVSSLEEYSKGNNLDYTYEHMFCNYIAKKFQTLIDRKENLFDEIDKLTKSDLSGDFIYENKDDKEIAITKNRIKVYITFQLLHLFCNDENKTKDEFKNKIQKYLFDLCFESSDEKKGFECFLDYLVLNYEYTHNGFKFMINKTSLRLGDDNLKRYWRKNSEKIKKMNFIESNKILHTINCSKSYKEELPFIYSELDKLCTDE